MILPILWIQTRIVGFVWSARLGAQALTTLQLENAQGFGVQVLQSPNPTRCQKMPEGLSRSPNADAVVIAIVAFLLN